jgi:hypothetical protein
VFFKLQNNVQVQNIAIVKAGSDIATGPGYKAVQVQAALLGELPGLLGPLCPLPEHHTSQPWVRSCNRGRGVAPAGEHASLGAGGKPVAMSR